MLKRILTLSLALVLSISCLGLARAASEEQRAQVSSAAATEAPLSKLELAARFADELKELGLFKGTDKGYELECTATRAQAVTMLLRLMGLETFAQARPTAHPFTDLPNWCKNAVGYAYHSQLAKGVSANAFAPNDTVNARAYLTFLLRALGYGSRDGLTWESTYDFAVRAGLIQPGAYTDDSTFLRADMVILSHRTLALNPKGSTRTLLEQVQTRPVFPTLANGFVNTAGASDGCQGDTGTFAGQLAVPSPDAPPRPTWAGTETVDGIMAELNDFVSPHYSGLCFTADGILPPDKTKGEILRFVSGPDGRMGVTVFHWRQDYNSNDTLNQKLNLALEAFLYLSGDGETAYALWSWLDAANVLEHGADTSAFGFADVETAAHGGIIERNGIRIEVDLSDPTAHTYWFDRPAQAAE